MKPRVVDEIKLAKARGDTQFESVNICPHGHMDDNNRCLRYVTGKGTCVQCTRDSQNTPEALKRRSSPEGLKTRYRNLLKWIANHPQAHKANQLKLNIKSRQRTIKNINGRIEAKIEVLQQTAAKKVAKETQKARQLLLEKEQQLKEMQYQLDQMAI